MSDDPIAQSYQRQTSHGRNMGLPSRFTAPDSVDNWRHTRMLAMSQPLVGAMPHATWLTVGDGAFGSDAAYLRSIGADVVASSLVTDQLEEAARLGYINEFRRENAEALSLADGSVDFVFCKEAYHHFPRPPIALYEMLRVSRVGVVLIEPMRGARLLDATKQIMKRWIRGDVETRFEPAGNYIYRIDPEELAHLMTAAGELFIAMRCFNDFYLPGLGRDSAAGLTRGLLLTRLGIGVQDALARCGLLAWGLCAVVLFKGVPSSAVLTALSAAGYSVRNLPVNPHLQARD